ncbi:MAG: hypothetical protein J1E29_02000 [Duncaniella sp.]|nr:hypothetical protein [Duncaniella sp.]
MSSIKIAAILRAAAYSPNHIGNDAAILNLAAEQLRKRGCEVRIYSEEQFIAGAVEERFILHMCRDRRSFPMLQKLEDDGALVVNSGYGVENCIRERLARILIGSGIPYPESIMVDTNQTVAARLDAMGISRAWIKKGEMYACHKEDVTYVRHSTEAQEMLQEYFLRGIRRAVINRHIDGLKLKFYGIAGSEWFYHSFPLLDNPEGPGPELFDIDDFRLTAARAAAALDILIYGGDAIVTPDGRFTIIDINDFPTFAPCRNEAAAEIARLLLRLIKARR